MHLMFIHADVLFGVNRREWLDLTLLFRADTKEDDKSTSSTDCVFMAGSVLYCISHLSFWHLLNGHLQADNLAMGAFYVL